VVAEVPQLKKIAEGREAEMFEWEGGRVLRLYRNGQRQSAALDARKLAIARQCGVRVPSEYGMQEFDGRSGFVMERIEGPDLLAELGAKPWRLFQVGNIWGRLQADLNSRLAPPELEPARLRAMRMIESSQSVPADVKAASLARLESLADGDRLLHGDFHPANIMRHGREFVVIDWSNIARGPAEADFYRSYLMCTLGDLPPGSPWLLRTLARVGRRVLRVLFVKAYRRRLRLDPAVIEQWKLPVVAARMTEGIEAEVPALETLARRLVNAQRSNLP
jgi:Ser/Thr protein kinase RdoA (MazF antagonist)